MFYTQKSSRYRLEINQMLSQSNFCTRFIGPQHACTEALDYLHRALIGFAEARCERLLVMDVNPLLIIADRCIAAHVMIRETTGSAA